MLELTDRARRLHASALVIDGHNDLPWALREKEDLALARLDLTTRLDAEGLHTDIPRLREGNLGAQFWSVYVPCSASDDGSAFRTTMEQIDLVHRMCAKHPDVFELAGSTEDVRRVTRAGKVASLMGVEGGHCIEGSLDKLRQLHARGARYMTLTHNKRTEWCDSATDKEEHGGLTAFGREVVGEMNRLGMLVDISHVSPKAMHAALDTTRAPVIASHSAAFTITPHPRNVPDDVLTRLKANGGVVMVVFFPTFIKHEKKPVDVGTLLDHIDHIVKVAGVDHVGLGSDFDGIPATPAQLEDVSKLPFITQGLLDRGYSDEDVRKVLGENVMRALAAAEAVAHG